MVPCMRRLEPEKKISSETAKVFPTVMSPVLIMMKHAQAEGISLFIVQNIGQPMIAFSHVRGGHCFQAGSFWHGEAFQGGRTAGRG